jgi:rod shape-determining protein MreB and related proteins
MFAALRPVLYVKVSPERLTVRNVKSGESVSEVPEMSISIVPKEAIFAVGSEAMRAS